MLRGLAAARTVGVVCPVLGAYVVLRGIAFFGDALAHIILPGVVAAFLLGWPLVSGALIVGVVAALAVAGLGLLALLAVLAYYKEFLVLSFDPLLAITLRLPVQRLQNLMLVLLAVVIVVSIQAVGVALVLAMLITPAAAASLLTRRLPIMMLVGAAIGALSAVVGLYLSYYTNLASGPAIVLTATVAFVLAFLFSRRRRARA